MEKCALCMTDINEGAIICTGCGAVREEQMRPGPKLLFMAAFGFSLFVLTPMLAFGLGLGWFALLLPVGIIVGAIAYGKKHFHVVWSRRS